MEPRKAIRITSSRNPLLKDIRRAVARGTLTGQNLAVAEGFHLLDEALRSGLEIGAVVIAASQSLPVEAHLHKQPLIPLVIVDDALFREISSMENSQGVIALVRMPAWSFEHLFRPPALVVVLDAIQDPGNAGAIVRAAEAFGATGILFLSGTVSPHNPKTLRAAAGSLFRLPMVHNVDRTSARQEFERRHLKTYAAMPHGSASLAAVDLTDPFALIMGSEGAGVSEQLRSGAVALHIPTVVVESLNVAMAAGIILYEAHRQRLL